MLSCSCDFGPGDCDWYYVHPHDYAVLQTKRRRRCASCRELINVGDTITAFERWRDVRDDVEESIYGDDGQVPLASMYHCERCADLYFSLYELGFECISPNEDVRELVKEYAREYGPRR